MVCTQSFDVIGHNICCRSEQQGRADTLLILEALLGNPDCKLQAQASKIEWLWPSDRRKDFQDNCRSWRQSQPLFRNVKSTFWGQKVGICAGILGFDLEEYLGHLSSMGSL